MVGLFIYREAASVGRSLKRCQEFESKVKDGDLGKSRSVSNRGHDIADS